MLVSDLVKVLVCPLCQGELCADDGLQRLVCRPCGLAYPVKNGIPVMLVDQAEKIV